jgi:hypothetical protein
MAQLTEGNKIELLVKEFTNSNKVIFKGKYYPIMKASHLPLIEDVSYWLKENLAVLKITAASKQKIWTLEVGELYFTSSKQVWVITQKWFQANKVFANARKIYPRSGEDHRLYYEGGLKKSDIDSYVQKLIITTESGTRLTNVRQLKK